MKQPLLARDTVLALALTIGGCAADPLAPPETALGSATEGSRWAAADETAVAGARTTAKKGTITITLLMRPEGPSDVAFVSESPRLRGFTLDDDADGTLSNTVTFTNVKPGAYPIRMATAPEGPLTAIRCTSTGATDDDVVDLTTRTVTLNVEAGESVSCTFVDGWDDGDLTTYSQDEYGTAGTTAAGLIGANFGTFYGNDLIIGGVLTARFQTATAVINYLPQLGGISIFSKNTLDPTDTSAGEYGGQLVALTLNTDFSAADILPSVTSLGDLYICDYPVNAVNGMTVDSFKAAANLVIGGTAGTVNAADASRLADNVNLAFTNGSPTPFAQSYLFADSCP